jgi:2Fe-2S ferredoxin
MARIIFVATDGSRSEVDAENGYSVMSAAVANGIDGIDAICGGVAACATCHVYVDRQWAELAGRPDENEDAMLFFASGAKETSRLSCQITVSDALDGLVLYLPEEQG